MIPQAWPEKLALPILIGALTFNAGLCFVNTSIAGINDTAVMGMELLLISTALFLSLGSRAAHYLILAVFISYAALLMAMRPLLDPKAVRDFLIPLAFYWLGRKCADPRIADRAALISGLIVIVFGVFEFAALDVYVKYFNILRYYVARGTVPPSELNGQTSALFASGVRPDARQILPFLGPHRASSVFLEPVSTGNFGAILYFWALNRPGTRFRWLTMAAGAGSIVLADARFGLYVCLAGTAVYFIARMTPRAFWLALPFAILSMLAIYGFTSAQVDWTNDIGGRMLWTARLITSLSTEAVWGLSPEKPFLSDSGYAYSLNQIGLIGLIGFWSLFIFAPENTKAAWRFKACVATYICLLLLISDSVYSIKTAALLWFMLGSSDAAPEPSAIPQGVRNQPEPRALALEPALHGAAR